MGKKDNEKRIATPELRRLFSKITAARLHKGEWDEYEKQRKEELLGEADTVDVTYVTEAGAEVGSITESAPSVAIDWKRFREDHPELEAEIRKYQKPAETSTRILTKWVEPEQLPYAPPN